MPSWLDSERSLNIAVTGDRLPVKYNTPNPKIASITNNKHRRGMWNIISHLVRCRTASTKHYQQDDTQPFR